MSDHESGLARTPARSADLSAVMGERRNLINIAYRLLGSLADAEDVVQDTYARWYALADGDRDAVRSPGAWLTTVATRICLDQLRSARSRRERYVGEWIPEPLPDHTELAGDHAGSVAADPADRITLDESVDMALLVVLDAMTPAERVAFLLHDVFGYSFAEIGEIVGRSAAACRQLASSARRRVRAAQPSTTPGPERAGVVREFKRAWEAKDIRALIDVLDAGAVMTADGGGLVPAALEPIEGGETIAAFLLDLAARTTVEVSLDERTVNGQPGLVAAQDGVLTTVFAFDVVDDQIKRIWAVRNPDKLRPWRSR
jgi:RNA polymerase sigma factor (sigma-70 family)